MHFNRLALMALLPLPVMGAPLLHHSSTPQQRAESPAWMSDYEAARSLARSQGKPLFVVFR